jgi:ribosomal protein S12 methylthiotransferase
VNPTEKSTGGAKRPFRFYIASLGCPKNTVDSSAMAVLLDRAGYEPTLDPERADVLIVNTCGFIESARSESLQTLEQLAASLRPDQRLIAAGCWAQRVEGGLLDFVPRIDALIGTRSWTAIVELVERVLHHEGTSVLSLVEDRMVAMSEEAGAPGYVVSGPSAFLKIADGCSRSCAFCAIPNIKGEAVSRDREAILADARALADMGTLEINLIAQDSTSYGRERGETEGLAELLERLVVEVPEVPWIRVLYLFPGFITPRLIRVMRDQPQILPYVDIPLQHAHPDVLRRMHRPADMDRVRETLAALREAMPGVALRTAFIVGYPGETEDEFRALMDFVEEIKFDRMGVFTYSHEPGTHAGTLEDDVPAEVKAGRKDALMMLQQTISYRRNMKWVGKRLEVLLEGSGDGVTVGRSYRDAPEIDGLVLIQEEVEPHRMVTVEVADALTYDLTGRVVADDQENGREAT